MNTLRSSLLITLLLTSSALSSTIDNISIDCKDGKCFASFVPSSAQVEQKTEEPNTIVEYDIEQEEDFVPFEVDNTLLNQEATHYVDVEQINSPETETDQTLQSQEPIIQEALLLAEGEIEYVCEEGTNVMCDIDTEMCICA